jgi:hypothetical protein
MRIDLSKKEEAALAELIYLGCWLVNSTRQFDNRIREYDSLMEKVLISMSKKRESVHDTVEEVIKQHETQIFSQLFAEYFSECLYPDRHGDYERTIAHRITAKLCEEEVRENGLKNVRMKLPHLESEIENALKKSKK